MQNPMRSFELAGARLALAARLVSERIVCAVEERLSSPRVREVLREFARRFLWILSDLLVRILLSRLLARAVVHA